MDFTPCHRIAENISRVIVGKEEMIELLLVALLADGHVLIEDVPGVGKTLTAKSLAKTPLAPKGFVVIPENFDGLCAFGAFLRHVIP